MASSNKTSTLRLNQWAANDPVLRTDFNADNLRLDTAIDQRALLRLTAGQLSSSQATLTLSLESCDLSQFRELQILCAPVITDGSYTGSFTGPNVQLSLNGGNKVTLLRVSDDPNSAQAFETHLVLTPAGVAGFTLSGSGAITAASGLGKINYNSATTLTVSLTDNAQFGAGTWFEVYGLKK